MYAAMAVINFLNDHPGFAALLQLFLQLSPVVVVALLSVISLQLRKLNRKK
jgi:hypothetical protein